MSHGAPLRSFDTITASGGSTVALLWEHNRPSMGATPLGHGSNASERQHASSPAAPRRWRTPPRVLPVADSDGDQEGALAEEACGGGRSRGRRTAAAGVGGGARRPRRRAAAAGLRGAARRPRKCAVAAGVGGGVQRPRKAWSAAVIWSGGGTGAGKEKGIRAEEEEGRLGEEGAGTAGRWRRRPEKPGSTGGAWEVAELEARRARAGAVDGRLGPEKEAGKRSKGKRASKGGGAPAGAA